jgi:hypothetical protein
MITIVEHSQVDRFALQCNPKMFAKSASTVPGIRFAGVDPILTAVESGYESKDPHTKQCYTQLWERDKYTSK